jgi:translation initiation factor 2 subunit 2
MAKNFRASPPVKEGDTFQNIKIEAVGNKGDGITKMAGFTIFVPGTRAEEIVNIRIIKVCPTVAFADVI